MEKESQILIPSSNSIVSLFCIFSFLRFWKRSAHSMCFEYGFIHESFSRRMKASTAQAISFCTHFIERATDDISPSEYRFVATGNSKSIPRLSTHDCHLSPVRVQLLGWRVRTMLVFSYRMRHKKSWFYFLPEKKSFAVSGGSK